MCHSMAKYVQLNGYQILLPMVSCMDLKNIQRALQSFAKIIKKHNDLSLLSSTTLDGNLQSKIPIFRNF